MDYEDIVVAFCCVVNRRKHTRFSAVSVDLDGHLGDDFGLDSIEMLEVWTDLEQALGLRILDENKRDIYTLRDVAEIADCLRNATVAG